MATFSDLRLQADKLAELWGYLNSAQKPDWATLVNAAYTDLVWDAEVIRGPTVTTTSVANQADYTLPSPDWKDVLDVYYVSTHLDRTNEDQVRRWEPNYILQAASTPVKFWMPRTNILHLYPTPSTNGDTITLYGIRAPTALSADSDVPAIPATYHRAIALRAAYLHSVNYAKGEAREVLKEKIAEYQDYVNSLKFEQAERVGLDANRYVDAPEPDRVLA